MAKGKYEYWISQEGLLRLQSYARDGLSDAQIAKNIGISKDTFYKWKKKYADFSDALKKGKEVVDIQVENALLKRALGYKYKEVTRERIIDTGQKKRHNGESSLTEIEWEFAVRYFEGKCCYCDSQEGMTKDHIKPLNSGGELSRDNVLPCCQKCNSSKKDKDMLEWYKNQKFFSMEKLEKIYGYMGLIHNIGEIFDKFNDRLVVTKEVEKEVTPDITAQIFWLKNRMPEKWRSRKNTDLDDEKQKAEIAALKMRAGQDKEEQIKKKQQEQTNIEEILKQIHPVNSEDVYE